MLDRIEADQAGFQPERIRAFVESVGVLQPMSRRLIIGKSAEEVVADAKHFHGLARRAAVLVGAV